MALVYVTDDEPNICKLVSFGLKDEGFETATFTDGNSLLEAIQKRKPDAIILDWMMPPPDGLTICRSLRSEEDTKYIPILLLTARGAEVDKVLGLELGADDYIVKPFLLSELILRVKALLRRTYTIVHKETGFYVDDKYIDFEKAAVIHNEKEIPLTPKEFIIIKKLWENKNKIVTNDALCLTAWGEDYYGHENTLMVHIRRLREKIEKSPSAPRHIVTVKGLGYKWVSENE